MLKTDNFDKVEITSIEDLRNWLIDNHNQDKGVWLVPVPRYVRDLLVRSESDYNIFSNKIKPYNNDCFKTLFRRFKRLNPQINKDITLYSLGTQQP